MINGERAGVRYKVSLRGREYFILPALSLNGLLHLKVVRIEVSSYTFLQFVRGMLPHLNKWPESNSVLVIDNASLHDILGLRGLVEERGARLLYLPPHSPDYNPVELSFSELNAWLGENHDYVQQVLESDEEESVDTVYDLLREAIHSITMENARAWYKTCGFRFKLDVPE